MMSDYLRKAHEKLTERRFDASRSSEEAVHNLQTSAKSMRVEY